MMEQRIDVMIDLETCSIRENAAIMSVAMVAFDIKTFAIQSEVQWGVDLTSCFMAGLHFDSDTQSWWVSQSPSARSAILQMDKEPIDSVVKQLYYNLNQLKYQYKSVIVWSNGIDFDFPKLDYLFRNILGEEPPYKYNDKRDMRTLYKELCIDTSDIQRGKEKHDALADCLWQIDVLKKAFSKLTMDN